MWFYLGVSYGAEHLCLPFTHVLQNCFLGYTTVCADGLFVQDLSGRAFVCADKMFLFLLF
jgi:hypothetical protein